ncbi:M48 family metalloprotease [Pirellulales bacterium]|nr:M48 family metalloprotease [Pirellulales bacterium]
MTNRENMNGVEPLAYQTAIRDYLKREESAVWNWYSSHRVRQEQADAIRFDLLKSTYRIDRDSQPDLYAAVDEVAAELDLDIPATLYQAQNPDGLNASTAYLPNEAHIIFHGPVATKLASHELRGLLAHELAHLLIYQLDDGEFLLADQVLAALTHDRQAAPAHLASARLFGLYSEIFCDRVALRVTGSPWEVISMLIKIATDIDDVDPHSFARQAAEVLSQGPVQTEGLSHPEAFIRARALQIWESEPAGADAAIAKLIEGPDALDNLDLIGQQRVMQTTRGLLDAMLSPPWLQTDVLLAHARLYFDDYQPPSVSPADALASADIGRTDSALRDYIAYVLLDFVAADRDLEEAPLAHALGIAAAIDLEERFRELAAKEMRLRKKQVEKIAAEREAIAAQAAAEFSDSGP